MFESTMRRLTKEVAEGSVNATVEKMAETAELIAQFPSVQHMSGPDALRQYARAIRGALEDVRGGVPTEAKP